MITIWSDVGNITEDIFVLKCYHAHLSSLTVLIQVQYHTTKYIKIKMDTGVQN